MIKGNPYLYQVRSERRGNRVVTVFEKYLGRADKIDKGEDNMEDAFTIGKRLKQEALQAQEFNQADANWQTLRSEIYNRDNGMCWICNRFVELKDYDLGHLVDRCNGGQDIYENLAVMHKMCNVSKPKHDTLEEAIIWKLRTRYLATERPTALFGDAPTPKTYSYPKIKSQPKTIPQAIAGDNELKLEAIRLLSQILGTPAIPHTRQAIYHSRKYIPSNRAVKPVSAKASAHYQQLYPSQVQKIVPKTIVWIQGRPQGGALWKVLPPPYKPEDLFAMRLTPPNAVDNGSGIPQETIQILDGKLEQEVNLNLGHMTIHITPDGDKARITFGHGTHSNIGKRSECVGMGIGQIPIDAWRQARAQGITFLDFKSSYPHATKPIA